MNSWKDAHGYFQKQNHKDAAKGIELLKQAVLQGEIQVTPTGTGCRGPQDEQDIKNGISCHMERFHIRDMARDRIIKTDVDVKWPVLYEGFLDLVVLSKVIV